MSRREQQTERHQRNTNDRKDGKTPSRFYIKTVRVNHDGMNVIIY